MKKRYFAFIAIVLMALVLILAMLPTVVSTDTVKDRAVQAINKRVSGNLSVAQWSLRWFGGLQCEGLNYEHKNKAFSVRIDQVALSKGLMALLFNYREPGRIDILNPHTVIQLPEKGIHAEEGKSPPGKTRLLADRDASPIDSNEHPGKNLASFTLPPIVADLKISNGEIGVVYADKKEGVVLKNLMLNVNIDEPGKTISYRLLAHAGEGGGRISGQGSLTIPSNGVVTTDQIRAEADLTILNWEMAPLLTIASAVSGSPMGEGRLNGRVRIIGAPASGIELTGQLVGTDVRLAGNGLKGDTPFFEKMVFDINVVQTGSDLTVKQLTVDSPMGKGFMSGRLSRQSDSRFETDVVLNLAEIFNQLPNTLGLKSDTKITDGLARLKALVASSDGAAQFDGHIHLDRLAGVSGSKHLAWDEPFEVDATGSYGGTGIHLDNFTVQSSFLSGEGRGDLGNLQVRLNADIRTALKEAGKFIDTKGWKGNGQMNLILAVGTRPGKSRFIEAELNIDGFQLNREKRPIVPKNRFASRLKTDFMLDRKSRLSALSQTTVDLNTWMGKTHIELDRLELDPNGNPSLVKNLSSQGAYDLKSLSTLIGAFYPMPTDASLSGKAKMDAGGHFDGKTVTLETLTLGVNNFAFRQAKRKIQDKEIHLHTSGQVNLKRRTAHFNSLEMVTTAGNVIFPELSINDWAEMARAVKGNGRANLDLATLVQSLEGYLDLLKEQKISGQAGIAFKADMTDAKKQILNLNCQFAPLKVNFGKGPLFDEKQADLSVALEGDRARRALSVKQMALSTRPLSINATGRFITKGQEQILTAGGDLGVDLDRLQSPLNKLLGTDITLTGKSKRPFSVRVETENGKWRDIYEHIDLSAALYADRIGGFGLKLTSVDIPVDIDKSLARASITGTVNEGELVLQPTIHLNSAPPVLSLPADSKILTDTGITKEMANELLSLIHPVFKGTMAAKGKVDLIVQTMSWPLPESAWKDAVFDGILGFKDVRLNTEGLIYDLLAAMKVKERDVFIGERTVEFSCRNGRVRCSPLRVSVKGYRMEVSGTMGLDGSLDYMAKIPITPEIVGDRIYPYVKGTTLDIPIGGTVSRPKLNLAAFDRVVQKMIQRAGRQALEQKAGDLLKQLFD